MNAIAKEMQWRFPEEIGEDIFVLLMGGLHVEMAILKAQGKWLIIMGGVSLLLRLILPQQGVQNLYCTAVI